MLIYQKEKRKKYTKQFKLDTVKLVIEEKHTASEVSRNLGIGNGTVQRWVREYKAQQVDAFTGNGRMSPEQEKIKELQAEVKRITRIFHEK